MEILLGLHQSVFWDLDSSIKGVEKQKKSCDNTGCKWLLASKKPRTKGAGEESQKGETLSGRRGSGQLAILYICPGRDSPAHLSCSYTLYHGQGNWRAEVLLRIPDHYVMASSRKGTKAAIRTSPEMSTAEHSSLPHFLSQKMCLVGKARKFCSTVGKVIYYQITTLFLPSAAAYDW